MVYEDAEKLYAEVRKTGDELLEAAFDVIFPSSSPLSLRTLASSLKIPGEVVAYNTTFFPRRDVVQLPLTGSLKAKLSEMSLAGRAVQLSKDGNVCYALIDSPEGGALGLPLSASRALPEGCMPASGEVILSGSIVGAD